MFITTANTLGGIPLPLQDRMEIIQLCGYTEFEKLNIAMKYLVPRQKQRVRPRRRRLRRSPRTAIRTIIHHYTKEAGVRNLEREIASVCRKVGAQVVKEGKEQADRDRAPRRARSTSACPSTVSARRKSADEIGLTNGLSVTDVRRRHLLDCEVSVVPGKGKLMITGLLEKGMEESAQAAMSYVRSRARALGLEPDFYQKIDVHVHFPELRAARTARRAGITMATSIAQRADARCRCGATWR